ncbi:MAG: prolyl oligopeptidase family serine peptidase [Phycisphaerae bacterium]|nr:prolyl oligopeptidase family serine peptidase [Phycisphaerae bacterium]
MAWIDADGARRDYGRADPGSELDQQTFAGHAWAVFDASGDRIGSLLAPDFSCVVSIPRDDAEEASEGASGEKSVHPAGNSLVSSEGARHQDSRGAGSEATRASSNAPGQARCRFVQHNLELIASDGAVLLRTNDGTADRFYGEPVYWSPDRSHVVVTRRTPAQRHAVHLIESSPPSEGQPRLHTFDYLKPGDRIEQSWPILIRVNDARVLNGAETGPEAGPNSARLFPQPWSIDHLEWAPDGRSFSFLYIERGHRVVRVIRVDAATGAATAAVNEEPSTFFDFAGKLSFERLPETAEILWMSERDGWNHLYLIDAHTGEVKTQVTKGSWVVRGVERLDRENRSVLVRVSGIDPKQDPYHVHYARVSLDGGSPQAGGTATSRAIGNHVTMLTEGDGTHSIEWSPDGTHFLDRWSRVDLPPVTELRRAVDGTLVMELERANWDGLLDKGWIPPQRFVAKGRDDTTDIWGVVWRPTVLRRTETNAAMTQEAPSGLGRSQRASDSMPARLPIIECIYAGPQDSFVPKSFSAWHGQRELAELGFAVVQIDGMGTSNRSKAFHDVCWKNLKDGGFPDRVRWIKSLAAAHPECDASRVGIYGGSAGGQNAMRAVLDHGDLYSAAAADCGCHDNRMDKIWWNELWMGWPVDESYAASSNVVDAGKLNGKLLLTVGELDRNVDPASTMQVVDALVRADKDFELVVLPGMGHGAGESDYGRRRRADFFVRHLLGVDPRRDVRLD